MRRRVALVKTDVSKEGSLHHHCGKNQRARNNVSKKQKAEAEYFIAVDFGC
jgi:hypothetical protein